MQKHPSQIVTLEDVLDAREQRAQIQAELRAAYGAPVVSITVNMPGNIKYSEETVSLVYRALAKVRDYMGQAGFCLLEERIYHTAAGPAAFVVFQGDAAHMKGLAVALETEEVYGRLLDIDVFTADGRQISRHSLGLPERGCFVCPENAVDCMRAKRHAPAEVAAVVRRFLLHHCAARANPWPREVALIGSKALEAMLFEAVCAPAPGLVDRFNSGAHKDMDIFTFIKSSSAVAPAMYQCALAAWHHGGSGEKLLPVLRAIGAEAEKVMFQATGGVNTQKGLLFLLGVVVAATASLVRGGVQTGLAAAVPREAANICRGIVERELAVLKTKTPERKLTAGERHYLAYGITGIRGEIEAGLPSVVNKGLPALRQALQQGLPLNDALIQTLLCLMTEAEDTTILNRHSPAVLDEVRRDAAAVLRMGGMYTAEGRARVEELDREYTRRYISPGGSADLLAVTYFLHAIDAAIDRKQTLPALRNRKD